MTTKFIAYATTKVLPIPGSKCPYKNITKSCQRIVEKTTNHWSNMEPTELSYVYKYKNDLYITVRSTDVGPITFYSNGVRIPDEDVKKYIDEPKHSHFCRIALADFAVVGIKK